jgi:hypothetical protein
MFVRQAGGRHPQPFTGPKLCTRCQSARFGARGGSCPASFRDYERAVILSSLSGTVVARDEFLPVWADVEAAMELDLLGVAVRAAWKERSSTIKRFQPMRSHKLGRRRVLLGDRVGCRRAMLPRRVGPCMVST